MTRLIGVPDLAAILNVDERHIYRLVAERRIPYIKWGHLLRFDADEVQRWLDDNRVEPLPPTRRWRGSSWVHRVGRAFRPPIA